VDLGAKGGGVILAADLFAGAGGCSTGLMQAAEARGEHVRLVAVNHWPIAVETHTKNHPEAQHFCASIETLDPRVAVPGGKLDLLIAAPECVFFSSARGGRPIDDQRRSSAWHILRWLELLRVDELLIENVPEMRDWAPIGANGRPLKSKKGQIFKAFIAAIEAMNYRVEWKVLNAADYGAAQTRRRLFIRARRGRRAVSWPAPTHSKTGTATLFGGVKKWRAAREVIDWSLPSQSIFTRKRPLQPATMRRIIDGLRRFGGDELQPFIMKLTHGDRVDDPLPTVTCTDRLAVVEPFILQPGHGSGGGRGDVGRVHSIDEPLGTQPTSNRFALVEPFVLSQGGGGVARPVSSPAPTIVAGGAVSLVEPFISVQRNNNTPKSLDEPVPALCTGGHIALVEPFLTRYYGSGSGLEAASVDRPLDTVTAKARFGLCQPVVDGYVLDIRFRMLQPHELSAAMSFPKSYVFAGNKGDAIRQIGNAVDCRMAEALCGSILDSQAPKANNREAVA